jgi:hypothetical protein
MSDKVFRVYSVIDKGNDKDGNPRKDFWHNLGTAFPHKDGKGFQIILEALPLDGKLVIREVEPKDAEEEDEAKAKTAEKRKPR